MPPVIKYTPNVFIDSLQNFTGRSETIEEIFTSIEANKSIAIIGERRIGKSLLLLAIERIVNNEFDVVNAIDKKLIGKIPDWQNRFRTYSAVRIELPENSSAEELLSILYNKLKSTIFKNKNCPGSLPDFFKALNEKNGQEDFIFLIDEMERLAGFKDFRTIASLFKTVRNNYNNIEFIHTGSYTWDEVISIGSNNSPWYELPKIYLNIINKEDAKKYLIQPLIDYFNIPELADEIIRLSGAKPLLLQIIGDYLYPCNELVLTELINVLIEKDKKYNFIYSYAKGILLDENLKKEQKQILALLCHKPNLSLKEFNKFCFDISYTEIKKMLQHFNLDYYGTINVNKNNNGNEQFSINSKLIELFGKEIVEPEIRKKKSKLFARTSQIISTIVIIIIGYLLFKYIHPDRISEHLLYSELKVTASYPSSLEKNEEATFSIIVTNNGKIKVDSLNVLLISNDILYYNKTKNRFQIINLYPNESENFEFNLKAIPDNLPAELLTELLVGSQKQKLKNIKLRSYKLKYYWKEIYAILALIVIIIFQYKTAISIIFNIFKKKAENIDIPA